MQFETGLLACSGRESQSAKISCSCPSSCTGDQRSCFLNMRRCVWQKEPNLGHTTLSKGFEWQQIANQQQCANSFQSSASGSYKPLRLRGHQTTIRKAFQYLRSCSEVAPPC